MTLQLRLCQAMIETHPGDAARFLERVSPEDATAALEQLPPDNAARVLERMEISHAAACLECWPVEGLSRIVSVLPVDVLAGVAGRTATGIGQRLLAVAPPELAKAARGRALHPENSAGALMNPDVFALPHDINAGEARLQLRRHADHISYYVYVVDRERKLVGVINLRQLMQAAAKQPLTSLMRGRAVTLSVHAGRKAILKHPGWRALHSLPVVDGKGVLRGVLRYETLRRIEEQSGAARGTDPVVVGLALMELYWSTATGMVQGVAGLARSVAARRLKEVRDGT